MPKQTFSQVVLGSLPFAVVMGGVLGFQLRALRVTISVRPDMNTFLSQLTSLLGKNGFRAERSVGNVYTFRPSILKAGTSCVIVVVDCDEATILGPFTHVRKLVRSMSVT